jgi:hypothetical protein
MAKRKWHTPAENIRRLREAELYRHSYLLSRDNYSVMPLLTRATATRWSKPMSTTPTGGIG